jgi:hypothetical protein
MWCLFRMCEEGEIGADTVRYVDRYAEKQSTERLCCRVFSFFSLIGVGSWLGWVAIAIALDGEWG